MTMSEDIVRRLRAPSSLMTKWTHVALHGDAAEEIERLREAHQAACEGGDLLRAEIERLREENEKLLEMVRFYADALEGKP